LLGKQAPRLVGLSEETACYISPEYFAQDDPFVTSSSTRLRIFSTTASEPLSVSVRPERKSGCSTLSTLDGRLLHTRAKATRACSRAGTALPSDEHSKTSTVTMLCTSRTNAWTLRRYPVSSARPQKLGTVGRYFHAMRSSPLSPSVLAHIEGLAPDAGRLISRNPAGERRFASGLPTTAQMA
jgi:hypothetical protein